MGFQDFNLVNWIETMLILVIAITVHEFAHAFTADRLGDPLPRSQGRISINPADHLDPTGTILMAISSAVGFGIGWGKPVQYNPSILKNPRRDSMIIAFWGPLSNFLQAVLFAAAIRLDIAHGWLPLAGDGFHLLDLGVQINLALMILNLIPIPPLDGFRVLTGLIPMEAARRYELVMGKWGMLLFLALIFTRALSYIIAPPVFFLYRLLLG